MIQATGRAAMNHFLPREKLKRLGADALSDAELLAIFLRTGSRGVPVMKLAQQMLQELGALQHRERQCGGFQRNQRGGGN